MRKKPERTIDIEDAFWWHPDVLKKRYDEDERKRNERFAKNYAAMRASCRNHGYHTQLGDTWVLAAGIPVSFCDACGKRVEREICDFHCHACGSTTFDEKVDDIFSCADCGELTEHRPHAKTPVPFGEERISRKKVRAIPYPHHR